MPPIFAADLQLDVRIPMRDGVELSADIYLPAGPGPFPTVLSRTPYSNNGMPAIDRARHLASAGYACVLQDCRGRWDSYGDYYPFREGEDGHDTQEWIARQDWSDGKVGTAGGSYGGAVQWQSAVHASPGLQCMVPRVICADYYSGLMHPGGAFQLGVMATWGLRTNARTGQEIAMYNWTELLRTLPLTDLAQAAGRDLPYWRDWVEHPTYDEYWVEFDGEKRWADIRAPAFVMGGWYDLYANQAFTTWNGMRLGGGSEQARQSRLIVGPWPHALSASTRTGDVDFGSGSLASPGLDAQELRWFDYWLKGEANGICNEPPVQLFIMGANQWRAESEWPLARTQWQKWYLHSGGSASTAIGDGVLSPEPPADELPDHYVYDPAYPVPTRGGNNCCSPELIPWGPQDQRCVEMRSDILVYTSEALTEDLEVTGPIEIVLHAATDGLDTDWTAKLVDVSPTGYAMNLCDGILRARYRDGCSRPVLLEPEQVYEYRIEVGVTGNVFLEGHRIRLEISSSNFPRFDRNLNTGGDLACGTDMRQARQTVHHSRTRPSHIILPVIATS